MAILASHTQGNLHMAMCVFQCCPLILDSHPSIKYIPSVQTSLTMECPKSHNPFFSNHLSFSHSQHLQFPFLWPALCSFSLVVSIKSIKLILIFFFSRPSSLGHPSLKCSYNPVMSLSLALHLNLVLAHLDVMEIVLPTYCFLHGTSSSK